MKLINNVIAALDVLIEDGAFTINQLQYDEKNFGNIIVVLNSTDNFNIRFVKDKGDVSCEIGNLNEWFWIEDLVSILGIKNIEGEDDILKYMKSISIVIKQNQIYISTMLNKQHINDTKKEIKEIVAKRVKKLLERT